MGNVGSCISWAPCVAWAPGVSTSYLLRALCCVLLLLVWPVFYWMCALRALKCSGSRLVVRYSRHYLQNNLRIVTSPSPLCPPFCSHPHRLPNSISTRHTPPHPEYPPQQEWYLARVCPRAPCECSCTRA